MKIYDVNHAGKPITGQENQRRVRDESHLLGFFARPALEEMLQPVDCVGIRFYNAGGSVPDEHRTVAVGVTADGSELNRRRGRGYFISTTTTTARNDKKITKAQARAFMLQVVRDRTPEEKRPIRFTSYFSKAMLAQLLASKNGMPV